MKRYVFCITRLCIRAMNVRRYCACCSATALRSVISATSTAAAQKRALEGRHYNTEFHLVAADYLDFTPVKICD